MCLYIRIYMPVYIYICICIHEFVYTLCLGFLAFATGLARSVWVAKGFYKIEFVHGRDKRFPIVQVSPVRYEGPWNSGFKVILM